MRVSAVLAAATLVAAASVPSEAASPPVLDGKRVRKVTGTAPGGLQANDADNASLTVTNRADCKPPRCFRLDFVYAPARGVRGNLLFTIAWTNPASDFDLYVANDKRQDVAHCGGFGGTSETLVLDGTKLRVGRKYTLVADFFRSVGDTVTATVEFPTKATNATTIPAEADAVVPTNCALGSAAP